MSSITVDKYAKPATSRMRRPEALERGKCYTLTQVCKEKSKFANKKTGKDVYKTLSIFEEFSMLFYVYMPYKYDDKPDEYFDEINKSIANGKSIRMVFYGKISGANELELLEGDTVVNKDKLEGIRKIEEVEAGESPAKKRKVEDI